MWLANKSNNMVYYCLQPLMNWLLLLFLKMSSFTARGIEEWVGKKYDNKIRFSLRLSFKSKAFIILGIFIIHLWVGYIIFFLFIIIMHVISFFILIFQYILKKDMIFYFFHNFIGRNFVI